MVLSLWIGALASQLRQPFVQWSDSGTMDIHVGPNDYVNDIRVNLWLSCHVPFASRYFTKPGVHRYPLVSSPCSLYRCSRLPFLLFFIVNVFRHPRDVVTCVWPDDDGWHHTERALRISLHRRRRKSHSWAIWPLVKLSDEPVNWFFQLLAFLGQLNENGFVRVYELPNLRGHKLKVITIC